MSIIKKKYDLNYIRDKNLILLEAISGSHAYGTNIATSDEDIRGIFIMDLEDYLGMEYVEQVSDDTNDTTFYEIGRFIKLLMVNNPNILELLNIPEDCIKLRSPLMDLIKSEDFISKLCKGSLGGYATEQIRKARGLNKKIVKPMLVEKKTPLDFCYILEGYSSFPLKDWLNTRSLDQMFCGLVNVPHARDVYALFYDTIAHDCFSEKVSAGFREQTKSWQEKEGKPFGLGYKGVEVDQSNTIRVSSVPQGEKQLAIISYNRDGYTSYCKDYKEYWDWDKKKNPERFKISSEKQYDCKNMMHCFRLTEMSKEIASGQGVIVRRPNREYLLKIRNGEMQYDELLTMAEKNLKAADSLFVNADLMDEPDYEKSNQILIEIRKQFYKI